MPSKQKSKGSRWERKVAELLTDWWGAPFLRTPNSGAMRWRGKAWEYGDLTPPEDFPCTIECKHEKSIDLNTILNGVKHKNSPLGWWQQALADAQRFREDTGGVVFPLVAAKANHQLPRLLIDLNLFWSIIPKVQRIEVAVPDGTFCIVNLEEFLSAVTKEEFLRGTKATVPLFLAEAS